MWTVFDRQTMRAKAAWLRQGIRGPLSLLLVFLLGVSVLQLVLFAGGLGRIAQLHSKTKRLEAARLAAGRLELLVRERELNLRHYLESGEEAYLRDRQTNLASFSAALVSYRNRENAVGGLASAEELEGLSRRAGRLSASLLAESRRPKSSDRRQHALSSEYRETLAALHGVLDTEIKPRAAAACATACSALRWTILSTLLAGGLVGAMTLALGLRGGLALYRRAVSAHEHAQRFESLVAHSPLGICLCEADGSVSFANQSARDLYGAATAEELEHYCHACQDSEGALRDCLRCLGGGEVLRFRSRVDLPADRSGGSGEVLHLDQTMFALPPIEGQPPTMVMISSDQTQHVRATESLRTLSQAVEQSANVVVITDADGLIEYVNPRFMDLTGYAAADVVGKHWALLEGFTQEAWARVLAALTSGQNWRGEIHIRKQDGERYWEVASISPIRDDTGGITHFVKTSEDITEQKQAQAKLRWQSRVDAALAGLSAVIMDSTDLSLEEVSRLVLEYAQQLTESQLGYVGYIDPDTGWLIVPTLTQEVWEQGKIEGKETVFKEFTDLRGEVLTARQGLFTNDPSADPRWRGTPPGHAPIYRFLSAPALAGELLVGQVALANPACDYQERDLVAVERLAQLFALAVQRVRTEQQLRESNQQLREALKELATTQETLIQQERLRALGQMASGVVHDFNNALTPVLGYVELLLTSPTALANKEKLTGYLETIVTGAKDAAKVVSRLRDFYRPREETLISESVHLAQLIDQALALTQPKWKDQAQARGLEINVETSAPALPPVAGDPSELRDALVNLIFNAVDAMPHGGTLRLEATAERTEAPRELVTLAVSDTGIGMTEEARRKCLEPFYTTKGDHGTGLGLAMVYGTVKRHAGEILIESSPGRGTTVLLQLPVYEAGEPAGTEPAAAACPQPLNILLVEDEARVRALLADYLAEEGHTVETASNGVEALEKFRPGVFNLVVTDRAMPQMNGDTLARTLRQNAPDQPILMLTGFGSAMRAQGTLPAGVHTVLGKPVTLAGLREAIAETMASGAARRAAGALQ